MIFRGYVVLLLLSLLRRPRSLVLSAGVGVGIVERAPSRQQSPHHALDDDGSGVLRAAAPAAGIPNQQQQGEEHDLRGRGLSATAPVEGERTACPLVAEGVGDVLDNS